MEMQEPIEIKAYKGGKRGLTIRKLSLQNINIGELYDKLIEVFDIKRASKWQIFYLNEEKSKIILNSEEALQNAIKASQTSKVRIYLERIWRAFEIIRPNSEENITMHGPYRTPRGCRIHNFVTNRQRFGPR